MMNEEAFKKLIKASEEGPSYGFSQKTMRKIEALENAKKPINVKGYNSLVVYLIPFIFLLLLISSFFLFDSQISMPEFPSFDVFNWSIPGIEIHFIWIISSAILSLGFWLWIWWEKSLFSKK